MGARNARLAHRRAQIASEAARLFVEQGLPGFKLAKRKAVQRMRLPPDTPLPTDEEVEQALGEYQRLFLADSHPHTVSELRRVSLELMT